MSRAEVTTLRPAGNTGNLTVSGTSQQSAAMPDGVHQVRVVYDATTSGAKCFLEFGESPVAVAATSMPLSDGATEYFPITPGEKIAAIGTDGTIYFTPMTK